MYSVDRVDVALEMEQWVERAALAREVHSAQFSISGEAFTLSSLYSI